MIQRLSDLQTREAPRSCVVVSVELTNTSCQSSFVLERLGSTHLIILIVDSGKRYNKCMSESVIPFASYTNGRVASLAALQVWERLLSGDNGDSCVGVSARFV